MAYLPLSTANLPDPVIDPAQGSSPEDYFNTVLYTGNGSSQSITGVGFSPDFLWLKERSSTSHHQLFHDIDGGTPKFMQSSSNIAEVTDANVVSSFDADGFSVGSSGGSNQSGQTYVGWNWYTGATPTSNTDGSITSSVSANTESGFSIVSYSGNSVAGATVGHGLSDTPSMIIVKSRTGSSGYLNWGVYHESLGATKVIYLNTTGGESVGIGPWNNTAPTSTVFSLGNDGGFGFGISGQDYIAYCFHSVEGFSKFGSYTGNGSTDGPFVYTGFRPAFVVTKRTDSTNSWVLLDSQRDEYNDVDLFLTANANNVESSVSTLKFDFLSNGFKLRGVNVNDSGGTFIFMAFAENPFKYSTAR